MRWSLTIITHDRGVQSRKAIIFIWLISLVAFIVGSGYYNLNRTQQDFVVEADAIIRKFSVRVAQYDTNVLALAALSEAMNGGFERSADQAGLTEFDRAADEMETAHLDGAADPTANAGYDRASDQTANAAFDRAAASIIRNSLGIRRIQRYVLDSSAGKPRFILQREVTAHGYKSFTSPEYEAFIDALSQPSPTLHYGMIKFKSGLNGGQFVLPTKVPGRDIAILVTIDGLQLLRGLISDIKDDPLLASSSQVLFGEKQNANHSIFDFLFPSVQNIELDPEKTYKSVTAALSLDGAPIAALASYQDNKGAYGIPGLTRDFEVMRGGGSFSVRLEKRYPLQGVLAWKTIGLFAVLSLGLLWGLRFSSQQRRLSKQLQESVQAAERRMVQLEQENKLAHAARVNSVGILASGIAHELTQPLTALLSQSQAGLAVLEKSAPTGDILKRALTANVREAQRAGRILGRLRDYVSAKEIPAGECELNQAVSDVLDFQESVLAKDNVSTVIDFAEPSPKAVVGIIELQQVVDNLIRNAVDALSVGCRGERKLIHITTSADNETSTIEIADNGPGISQDAMDRMFQPFFTTKNQGMGLGLSLCSKLLERVGGKIEVRNDEGAVFKIVLPRAKAGAAGETLKL